MLRHSVFALPLLLAACGGYLAENYSSTRFDGYMTVDSRTFAIALHGSRHAFVTQVEASVAIGQAFSGNAGRDHPDSLHRRAAEQTLTRLAQLGCSVTSSRRIDMITVEHDYACRNGHRLTATDIAGVTEQGVLTRR